MNETEQFFAGLVEQAKEATPEGKERVKKLVDRWVYRRLSYTQREAIDANTARNVRRVFQKTT